jgi:hypothetical protein
MHVQIVQGRWLRSGMRLVGIGALWLAYAAGFTWLAFHHHERSTGGEAVRPGMTVVILLLALPGYMLGIRELRSGLWIDRTMVVVRGIFRAVRLYRVT